MIYMQTKGMASIVQSYSKWQELDVQVNQGAKALAICMPNKFKGYYKGDEFNLLKYASKEDKAMIKSGALKTFDVVTFRLKNCVFDAEQTNISDEKLFQLSNNKYKDLDQIELFNTLKEYCNDHEIKVVPKNISGGNLGQAGKLSDGSYQIWLDVNLGQEERNHVFLHEIAHQRLGHNEYASILSISECEIQAETFAYLSCKDFGIDTDKMSKSYVSNYFKDKDLDALCDEFDDVFKLRKEIFEYVKEKEKLKNLEHEHVK